MKVTLKVSEVVRCGRALQKVYDSSLGMTFSNAYKLRKVLSECEYIEEYVSRRLSELGIVDFDANEYDENTFSLLKGIEESEVEIEIPEITVQELMNDKCIITTMEDIDAIKPIITINK